MICEGFRNRGSIVDGPHIKGYSILGLTREAPGFWKLPHVFSTSNQQASENPQLSHQFLKHGLDVEGREKVVPLVVLLLLLLL